MHADDCTVQMLMLLIRDLMLRLLAKDADGGGDADADVQSKGAD